MRIKKGEKNKKGEEKEKCWRKRKKGEERKHENFPAFRRSKLNGSRIKVGSTQRELRVGTKSGSFLKLQEVENFPTRVFSSIKASFNGIGFLRGMIGRGIQFQDFGTIFGSPGL